jgi:hypothetical protein
MQILSNLIEFYWIHSRGVGALENSLWGYDGHDMCVWLDVLTIENSPASSPQDKESKLASTQMNLSFPLDFYPLCKRIVPETMSN